MARSARINAAAQLADIAALVERMAIGDFSVPIPTGTVGDAGRIMVALASVQGGVVLLRDEVRTMISEHDRGDIDVIIAKDKFRGLMTEIADDVNNLVGSHIRVKKQAMAVVKQIGAGDTNAPMEVLPGKKAFITEVIEQMRSNWLALLADVEMLTKAAAEGRLSTRADLTRHQGAYRTIVEGVNNTLDAVIGPLTTAAECVDSISKGAIPAKITDSYNGDFNVLKNNLNTCIDAVNALVADASMLSKAAVEGRLETRADAGRTRATSVPSSMA